MSSTLHDAGLLLRALEAGYRRAGATNSGVLLAVSGGADSTALLLGSARLAGALGLRLEVACLDHGLRPEAKAEVAGVAELAARLGLPFHTRALALEAAPALEERARQARYSALEEIRAGRGLEWIATAHTASDQAETLLMRLARGASLKGAAGVLPRRERILRPLLACTRAEVEAFLSSLGQGYTRDPMNEDPAFLRTRIRRGALPALVEAAGASAVRHLAEFAELAREDEALLGALAEDAARRLQLGPSALDATGVRALLPPLRRRVVARLLAEQGLPVNLSMVRRAMEALERGGRAGLARGWEVRCAGGVLRCVRPGRRAAAPEAALRLSLGETVEDKPSGLIFGLARERPAAGVSFIELDASVVPPLTVRRRRPGDRVAAGPRGGSRKLQDVLVDLRVKAEERDQLPVVTDGEGRVIWVPGVWQAAARAASGLYLFVHLHAS